MPIRRLTKRDLPAYGSLCQYAFGMTADYTRTYERWVGHFLRHAWGAFDGRDLAAGLWSYPYQMRVGDRWLRAAGVAAVATRPESRNQGLVRALMTRAHEAMRADGCPLAALMPFKHSYYRDMGYADAFFQHEWSFAPAQLARRPSRDVRLRRVDPLRVLPTLTRLHDAEAARRFGGCRRDSLYWRTRFFGYIPPGNTPSVYLAERRGRPTGFLLTLLSQAPTGKAELRVTAAVWQDEVTLDALLAHLLAHRDQVTTVRIRLAPDVDLFPRFDDPKIEVALRPRAMLKLVDLAAALERRAYDTSVRGEVVLEVEGDPTSPWNAGRWRVAIARGRARVTSAKGAADLRTDIQTLAIAYAGRRSLSTLIDGDPHSLALIDLALPQGTPYLEEAF